MATAPTTVTVSPRRQLGSRTAENARKVPWFFHVLAGGWIASMLLFARASSEGYYAAMQEDRLVEWATVALFLVAGTLLIRHAASGRRPFDLLVGLFCIFVAGEEFSWGQRLIGFAPPEPFLEHNTQQEANIHNFAIVFGHPKSWLILTLMGYGLLLPTLARFGATRRVLQRVGATPPPLALSPWFAAAVALLYWYPVRFTGEWVELLAGSLFFAAASPSIVQLALGFVVAPVFGLAMTEVSEIRGASDPAPLVCARAEVQALISGIVGDGGATQRLKRAGSVHKRIWTSLQDEYITESGLRGLAAVSCPAESPDKRTNRRRFVSDPWGTAYWLRAPKQVSGDRRVIIYSFGPNRRRDGEPGATNGDDIAAEGRLRAR